MKPTLKIFLILLLWVPVYLSAYYVPTPAKDELITVLLSDEQLNALISKKNYGSPSSPNGVCYGMDRTNYALLTQIHFEPGYRDTASVIENKILTAYRNNAPQNIHGFKNLKEFTETMEKGWDKFYNPLRRAVEQIQNEQNPFSNAYKMLMRTKRILYHGTDAITAESKALMYYLTAKSPVSIGIFNWGIGHALTVIGFSQKLDQLGNRFIDTFYVLDSNTPWEVQKLTIRKQDPGTSQEKAYWYYEEWEDDAVFSPYVFLVFDFPTEWDKIVGDSRFEFHQHLHPDLRRR